jgi:streptogramin lyase
VAVLGAIALFDGWQGAYAVVAQPRVESPRPTLDGTAYLASGRAEEAAAFDWLNSEVRGTPVIAEAQGDSYREFARVSMNTGLPTLLGWDYHVHQRGHEWPEIEERKTAVARLYDPRNAQELRALLDRYGVAYVYVGDVERRTYGADVAARLAAFGDLLKPVYANREVLILASVGAAAGAPAFPFAAAPPTPPTPAPGLLREPRAVAVDEEGHVWVADFGHDRLQALGTELEPLVAFGGRGAGPAQFDQPCALALAGGRVYVADTWNGRVQVLARDGRMTAQWRGSFFGPRGIAVGPDGRVYLADTGNNCIRVFDGEGKEVATWGRRGAGPGEMEEPMGVAVDARGRVYVCDNGNARVQVLDGAGAFVRSFPVPGWRTAAYSEPKIAVTPAGIVWVTVPLADVVRAYDAGGALLRELRGPEQGAPFRKPLGIAYDRRGPSLLVTDLEDRVVRVPLPREAAR